MIFVGLILFVTVFFTLFGIVCGLIGFIMLIIGLFTSSYRPPYQQPPQVTTTVYAPPPPPPQYAQPQPVPKQGEIKYCQACGTPTSKDTMYCGKCGKKFLE